MTLLHATAFRSVSKVTVDWKVGLGSSWWNTAQDFSQVKGKWIFLSALLSVRLVKKKYNCLNHWWHSGVQTGHM